MKNKKKKIKLNIINNFFKKVNNVNTLKLKINYLWNIKK